MLQSFFTSQRTFFGQLSRLEKTGLCLMLLIQAAFYSYYISTLPVRYDESLSYVHFISKGFVTTASYYPFPNNHVFHNLWCCLFVKLPLPTLIAIRLTSLLVSLFAAYYFFKLAKLIFDGPIALFCLGALCSFYPFIIYATQARGYSMLFFFTILLMYAVYQLVFNYSKRYELLYVTSMVLGLYTLPSFLYTIFSVNLFLFIYILKYHPVFGMKRFVLYNALGALVTFCLYLPLFYVNGFSKVMSPNENETRFSFQDPSLGDQLLGHFEAVSTFLFGNAHWANAVICIAILVLVILYLFLSKTPMQRFMAWLCLCLFLCPLLILAIHRVFPFERTWAYLMIPIALSIGFFLSLLRRTFQRLHPMKRFISGIVTAAALALNTYFLDGFKQKHQAWCFPEYMIQHTAQLLQPDFARIHRIAYSAADLEFYPAEIVFFEIYRRNRAQPLEISKLGPELKEDLVVLNDSELEQYAVQLNNYNLVDENTYQHYKVYLRK